MNEMAKNYILNNYVKIADLKLTNKATIELVVENYSKNIFVRKILYRKLPFYKTLVSLEHKNLAKVYMVFLDDNTTYVIEEYVKGESLDIILSQKDHLSEKQVINIALQLCSCLAYLHKNKIAHLDIKPANIIICENDLIKIIDFDAAKIIGQPENFDSQKLGTKGYAPPEQYSSAHISEKADIFSLGVTLKELLGNNYNGYLLNICNQCTILEPAQRIATIEKLELLIKQPNKLKLKMLFLFFLLIITYSSFIVSKSYNFFAYSYNNDNKNFLTLKNSPLTIPLDNYNKNVYYLDNLQITSQKIPLENNLNGFTINLQITANMKNNQNTKIKIIAKDTNFIRANSPENLKFTNIKQNNFQTILQHNFSQQHKMQLSFTYLSSLSTPQLEIFIDK